MDASPAPLAPHPLSPPQELPAGGGSNTVQLEGSGAAENEGLPPYLPPHLLPPGPQYTFYQFNRNKQVLEPNINGLFRDLYTIEFRTAFSRKPDMTLIRSSIVPPPSAAQQPDNSAPGTRPKALSRQVVATVTNDKSHVVPYYPRATVLQNSTPTADESSTSASLADSTRCTLEARDMNRWTFSYAGVPLVWDITADPTSFTLFDARTRNAPLARFTFSSVGTSATGGAEIGKFVVFRGPPLTGNLRDDGGEESDIEMRTLVELLICTYTVAVTHHVNMGKKFTSSTRHTTYRPERDLGNAEAGRWQPAGSAAWSEM